MPFRDGGRGHAFISQLPGVAVISILCHVPLHARLLALFRYQFLFSNPVVFFLFFLITTFRRNLETPHRKESFGLFCIYRSLKK